MKTGYTPYIIVLLIALILGVFTGDKVMTLFMGKDIPRDLQATLLERAKPLQPFELIDHNNQPLTHASLAGKWSFLFFGYTHCPDVCPLAMQNMKQVWKLFANNQVDTRDIQMIMISVDPERDKPADLKQYARYYHPDFIGATAKLAELDNITGQLGILYGYDEPDDKGNYHVNHSGQIILIDPQVNMRGVFSPPQDPNQIYKDFLKIKAYVE